jgi:YesN/AraC family two-component response regulator
MKKGNLLLIDDEELILKGLKFYLEDYVDEIFLAENGAEGLKIAKEKEVHCIICDINMPVMNGVEVIKGLRATDNDVPFIFYTGHGNHELMMEAIKYGAFDFLNKPSMDGLEDVVVRGLAEGLHRNSGVPERDPESFVSEYQELLSKIKK